MAPRKTTSKCAPTTQKTDATLQDLILRLSEFWAGQGCILQQPYDLEVGAGTSCPETFLRALGPQPYRVAYVQPSRRPDDGRYGENPNRLYKHLQWQVMLDGLEITQFTYFQQCGGIDLDPISVELTYGLERIAAFLQDTDSVYSLRWNETTTYGQVRWQEEQQFSVYNFEMADVAMLWKQFDLNEQECRRLLDAFRRLEDGEAKARFPVLAAYDLVLKCSHLFNLLDSRGALSVTERASVIARVRALACGVAATYLEQPRLSDPDSTVSREPTVAR